MKFKLLQWDSNPHHLVCKRTFNHLAKLSVRFRIKWLLIQTPLQSSPKLFVFFFSCNFQIVTKIFWKGELGVKYLPFFLNTFVKFMEKEPSKKFWGLLFLFHEIRKLENVEFNVNDVIPANVHNISCHITIYKFLWRFDHFTKLKSNEFWND